MSLRQSGLLATTVHSYNTVSIQKDKQIQTEKR